MRKTELALSRSDANRGYKNPNVGDTFLVKDNGVRSWKKDVSAIYLCLGQWDAATEIWLEIRGMRRSNPVILCKMDAKGMNI